MFLLPWYIKLQLCMLHGTIWVLLCMPYNMLHTIWRMRLSGITRSHVQTHIHTDIHVKLNRQNPVHLSVRELFYLMWSKLNFVDSTKKSFNFSLRHASLTVLFHYKTYSIILHLRRLVSFLAFPHDPGWLTKQ